MTIANRTKNSKNPFQIIGKSCIYAIKKELIYYNEITYMKSTFIDGSCIELRIYDSSLIAKVG